jgi:hypothetical protein
MCKTYRPNAEISLFSTETKLWLGLVKPRKTLVVPQLAYQSKLVPRKED